MTDVASKCARCMGRLVTLDDGRYGVVFEWRIAPDLRRGDVRIQFDGADFGEEWVSVDRVVDVDEADDDSGDDCDG